MVTETIMKVLSNLFRKIADDIDCGNSNITENEALELIDSVKKFTDKTERISKYEACRYLNISRATFDNYVRAGLIPKGEHRIGFKELSWQKKDLDDFIISCRKDFTSNSKSI